MEIIIGAKKDVGFREKLYFVETKMFFCTKKDILVKKENDFARKRIYSLKNTRDFAKKGVIGAKKDLFLLSRLFLVKKHYFYCLPDFFW